jgi:transcriptional regulator with XRE-family HTH domain
MNIETANRLLAYRKKFGYSQEQLAEKLGLSRQAVSKWERAEASPDTDNLIELARLYGISLDELVLGGESDGISAEIPADTPASGAVAPITPCEAQEKTCETETAGETSADPADNRADDRDEDTKDDGNDDEDDDGPKPNESRLDWWLRQFPTGVVATVIYLILGFACHAWHPGWLVFLLIPVADSIIECIRERSPSAFAYSVFCAFVYLLLGFYVEGAWLWGWVVFVTIPVWGWIISLFRS